MCDINKIAEGALVVSSVDEALQIAREETARTDAPYIWIELRPETWTRLMVAVMRLPVGPDPGILPGSGP